MKSKVRIKPAFGIYYLVWTRDYKPLKIKDVEIIKDGIFDVFQFEIIKQKSIHNVGVVNDFLIGIGRTPKEAKELYGKNDKIINII